jgi:hypothetical protein
MRWTVRLFAFIAIVMIWNGRRVVNAVIAPSWERIRHYADLQAAQNISLSVVVIYIACRVNTPL